MLSGVEPSGGPLGFFNYDLIIMSMALHYIDNPKKMVVNLVERLKPDDRAIPFRLK